MKAKTAVISLLALTTAGGALLAWRQYQELVELRAAALNTDERADLQKRLWDMERANRELADRLAAGPAAGDDLASMVATATADPAEKGDRAKSSRGDSRGRGSSQPTAQFNALRELMAKPEVQALLTSQQKAAIEARYAALFKSLALSPDQTEKLKSLLAERQTTRMDVMEAAQAQGIDPRKNPEAYRKLQNDARNEVDATIKSAIGDAGFAKLQSYEQTLPQRNLVNDLQQRLSYTNTPLNSAQADQLVQILANNAPQRPASTTFAQPGTQLAGGPAGGSPGASRGTGFDSSWGGRGGDLGGLLALGGGAGFMGPGDAGRGGATITTAAVNQAQGVLSQPQVAVLQQLQQQQQGQQQIQQMVRDTLAAQGKSSTKTATPAAGTSASTPPTRKRGGR